MSSKGRSATSGSRTGERSSDADRPSRSSPTDNALLPWHLFVLGGLAAATAAVVLVRGTGPVNIIFISLAIGTASLTGIAAFRTLAPLAMADLGERVEMVGGRTRTALEREKMLVLRSIKELEFDRAMHKVSDADFQEMMVRLRARAARLITQLDGGAAAYTNLIEREVKARMGPPSREAVQKEGHPSASTPSVPSVIDLRCSRCGTPNDADAHFCKRCGGKIAVAV